MIGLFLSSPPLLSLINFSLFRVSCSSAPVVLSLRLVFPLLCSFFQVILMPVVIRLFPSHPPLLSLINHL